MLRNNRVYRFLRAGVTMLVAIVRYLALRARRWIPGLRPTERSWQRAHRNTGRAIHGLATNLGGAFVKLGQVLGARADVMPPALIEPLRGLHDRVPPRPFAALRHHVERELGRPIASVFAEVDEEPIAAASLAQVHRARLITGEAVVIKIQYPEARRLFPIDLGSLRRSVRIVRWLARIDLRPLADELAAQIVLELDFAREAASTDRVRAAFAGQPGIRVPLVHRELSTDRLLVLEFVEGTALTDLDRLRAAGADLRRIAGAVADLYATMIFEHGFFHGDPHPGNILVSPDHGTIVLLDFGLTKELPPGFGDGAAAMIVRGLSGDLDGAIAAARSIGFEATGDPEAFRDLVRALMGDNDRARHALDSLRAASVKGIPSDFAIIGRAFILLNGLSHRLAPGERLIASAVARRLMPRVLAAGAAANALRSAP
ncbi:MAG: AarF/ABC1/UbiB kinase family protein [Kofleriaceae bacterium]|nr:AarF/ABC1/UbiB kinase family protein [Kofleriaceae bacterium]MCL4224992.1 AarF/ABC1/UbiB kinase family protein [Myxococcales bacterium]